MLQDPGQPGWSRDIPDPALLLGAGSLWDVSQGCRNHFLECGAVWGRWDVSTAICTPASLRSGTECPCHGKIPWEELWHLPAAPALAVITPWLSGWDEIPQLLGDGTEGPCCSPQGNSTLSRGIPGLGTTRNGATHPSTFHPFPAQNLLCHWRIHSAPHRNGKESLWDHKFSQENPKIRRGAGLTCVESLLEDATGGKLSWEGGKKREMCV